VVDRQSGRKNVLLLLVKGCQQADEAAQHLSDLASESGRLYQTLPPFLAPVHGTTSPRNLWATILYGRLQGTPWVRQEEGYECIPLPFAASAELWRRLMWGTTPDGRVEAGSGSPGLSDPQSVLDKEIERINQLHQLAGRCLNPVLALDHLRHCADGNKHGLDHLVKLRDAVLELPPLPLADDPFCRDSPVETAGIVATSAHIAALRIGQRTWDTVQLRSLEAESVTRHQDEEGISYTRITSKNVRRAPTEGEWSADKWREGCQGLGRFPAPDAGWFEAALAQERNLAARRLEGRFGIVVTATQIITPQQVVEFVQPSDDPAPPSDQEKNAPPHQAVEVGAQASPVPPAEYLLNWRDTLDALDLKNTEANRGRVRKLNKQFEGPITLPGKGGQPKVSKEKLLSWWNGLEERFRESEQKQADTQATIQVQHDYGRDGTVLPDISGHVQKRRGKKSDQ
jgi:hypothetical protein